MAKIEKKQKADVAIPTGSMGDIVFLLLIFFMVTTVFVEYRGLAVEVPRAEMTERLDKKRGITHMWIDANGVMMIDDYPVKEIEDIAGFIYPIRVATPKLIVSIVADVRAPYGTVSDAMRQLREADALQVNFSTLYAFSR